MTKEEQRAYSNALYRIDECRRNNESSLDLTNLNLTHVPPEIGRLVTLKQVYLRFNKLTTLPQEIAKLANLSQLFISNNQLTALPRELAQLVNLSLLHLGDNRLTALPKEFAQLVNLEVLILEGNRLTSLPEWLRRLPRLSELTLHGNHSLGLPKELLGPVYLQSGSGNPPVNPQGLLDYYFARKLEGSEAMREVRVLFVGRGRVGKTSLLKVLRGGKLNAGERETPGITVLPLPLQCTRGKATAHAWDFGGQEFLHGTHQIFLSERCVYLLVLEGRESNWETETDYWLRFIQSFGGDSPVVVALNKYDEHAFTVDRFRLQEKCPQIAGFVQTDAATGCGIAELRALLEATVNGMPDVWLGVPRRWHRVKERLGKMTASFLDYKEYQALCATEQVTDEGQQASLAETLHRLGIALNFRDHQRLKETSVLKPQWVTEGIYGVLRFLQKQDCHGVLQREWLAQALPAQEYPPEKHGFVMELMEKFEVAFPLEGAEVISNQSAVISSGGGAEPPGAAQGLITDHCSLITSPTRWLIPELLPEVQPAAFAEFRVAGVKRLRFSYPEALPPGLLPRFIVRTHELSAAHPEWRWRSGVVLTWGEAKALVRLDRSERRTEVAVLGPSQEEGQSLFDIIRAHLAVLHGNVPVIEEVQVSEQPEKWVPMAELRMAEQEQEKELKVTVGQKPPLTRITVPVVETMRTVESAAATEALKPEAAPRMQLFISYARENEKELAPFRQHLTLLSQQGYIQVWHDRDLVAGELWERGIREVLERADIVLLFYTTAARVSEFIQETELAIALERAEAGRTTLLWVPLERNDLDQTHRHEKRLHARQCATRDAVPIYDFEVAQKGWLQVEQSIRQAVEARRKLGP
jgi:internalin A